MGLQIEFKRGRTWMLPWIVPAFITAIAVGIAVAKYRASGRALASTQAAASELAGKSQTIRMERDRAAKAAAHDENAVQLARADAQLNFDWNPVFATIENVQEPGVRLVSISAAAGQDVRLEYQVPSIEAAAHLSLQLNGGTDSQPWHFVGVVAAPSVLGVPGFSDLHATWVAETARIR